MVTSHKSATESSKFTSNNHDLTASNVSHPLSAKHIQGSSEHCVIIGHSINAITTATVLASFDNIVTVYADEQGLEDTLATYSFEYQQQALWQLYTSQQQIIVRPMPSKSLQLFDAICSAQINADSADSNTNTNTNINTNTNTNINTNTNTNINTSTNTNTNTNTNINTDANPSIKIGDPALYWVFYNDLPLSWHQQTDAQEEWVTSLNQSQLPIQTPLILSGISKVGIFSKIAQHCYRSWVYYIPFVFLQDGQAYASMLSPKLWLMGEKIADAADKVKVLQPLIVQAKQSYITDIGTIEFARSAIMSMLATRVSFMNEWSRLADGLGVDIMDVSTIMGLDSRIGKSYLQAGWGFGGKTLPAEISALQDTLGDMQMDLRLMRVVNEINDDQKELVFRKFWQYFDGRIEGRAVSIWGVSYKAGSGRTLKSAIHPLLRLLWSYHITTYVYASEASTELANLYPDQPLLQFIEQPTDKLDAVDALFIMAWASTKPLPIASINAVVVPVFDAQNALSKQEVKALKGVYKGIGRKN